MKGIVAVDKNWAIGNKNDLLVSIPADKRFFKAETTGKVVVMGRKTLESFPGGKPLAQRTNIVITNDKGYSVPNAIIVHSIEEAMELVKRYNTDDVYIIGGGTIYKQFLPYMDMIHVTKIEYEYEADTYFPNLDEMDEWVITGDSEEQTYFDLEYRFYLYQKKK